MGDTRENAEPSDRPPESPLDSDRYARLSLDDDAVVIYDREQPDTWLQSDFVAEIGVRSDSVPVYRHDRAPSCGRYRNDVQ